MHLLKYIQSCDLTSVQKMHHKMIHFHARCSLHLIMCKHISTILVIDFSYYIFSYKYKIIPPSRDYNPDHWLKGVIMLHYYYTILYTIISSWNFIIALVKIPRTFFSTSSQSVFLFHSFILTWHVWDELGQNDLTPWCTSIHTHIHTVTMNQNIDSQIVVYRSLEPTAMSLHKYASFKIPKCLTSPITMLSYFGKRKQVTWPKSELLMFSYFTYYVHVLPGQVLCLNTHPAKRYIR